MADITVAPVLLNDKKKRDSSVDSIIDEKILVSENELEHNGALVDLHAAALMDNVGDVYDNVRAIDLGADGKERPIGEFAIRCAWFLELRSTTVTSIDYAVRLISLEDDPSLPIWTFRMWLLALGLSCFGAVLGQIFVSYTLAARVSRFSCSP